MAVACNPFLIFDRLILMDIKESYVVSCKYLSPLDPFTHEII